MNNIKYMRNCINYTNIKEFHIIAVSMQFGYKSAELPFITPVTPMSNARHPCHHAPVKIHLPLHMSGNPTCFQGICEFLRDLLCLTPSFCSIHAVNGLSHYLPVLSSMFCYFHPHKSHLALLCVL